MKRIKILSLSYLITVAVVKYKGITYNIIIVFSLKMWPLFATLNVYISLSRAIFIYNKQKKNC